MTTCIMCDGWIEPGSKVSKEIRAMLTPRGKACLIEETGRVAHWGCVDACRLDGITWKEQRFDAIEG
jgi:hypothetical protein